MDNLSPKEKEEEIVKAIYAIRDYYECKFIDKGILLYDVVDHYLKNNTVMYHLISQTLDWDETCIMGVFSFVYRVKDSENICHGISPWICTWENFLGWDGEYGS